MKEFLLPILVFCAVTVTLGVFGYHYGMPYTKAYIENRFYGVIINDIGIDVRVADTQQKRVQGLSGVDKLASNEGLLMVFDTPDYQGIWMKDMLFPIDIIWIDNSLTIIDITPAATPESYPKVFEPQSPTRFILEMNARAATSFGFKVGQKVRIADTILPKDLKNK